MLSKWTRCKITWTLSWIKRNNLFGAQKAETLFRSEIEFTSFLSQSEQILFSLSKHTRKFSDFLAEAVKSYPGSEAFKIFSVYTIFRLF